MKSAQTFYGDDRSAAQPSYGLRDRIFAPNFFPRPIPEFDPGPAVPASIRLGVKAPVERILIFLKAGRTHGERRHRGARPVVRNVANDGETRPAVGAIDEWIEVTPVVRVEHLTQAIRADCDVRRNQRANLFPLMAMKNAEVMTAAGVAITERHFSTRNLFCAEAGNPRQRRRFGR